MTILFGCPGRTVPFVSEQLKATLTEVGWSEASLLLNKNIVGSGEDDVYIECRLEGFPKQCGIILYAGWSLDSVEILEKHLDKCHTIARRLLYTKAMITHNEKDFIDTLVKEHGWKIIDEFKNQRSGNVVYVATFDL